MNQWSRVVSLLGPALGAVRVRPRNRTIAVLAHVHFDLAATHALYGRKCRAADGKYDEKLERIAKKIARHLNQIF
jgi:hypothetical protein